MSGRAGRHVVEYAFEAFGVALFMLSACAFGALLEHPRSPMPSLVPNPGARRALMGLAMGCTALVNVYSPWGRRSRAHLNPSVSLTFLRLGMLASADALFFVLFQFAGAAAGVTAAGFLLGHWASDAPVRFALTPGGTRGDTGSERPRLERANSACSHARHGELGDLWLSALPGLLGEDPVLLFTENETNQEHLYGAENATPYVKDAFHDYLVRGRRGAVNPEGFGTKA